jgi:hypothetical protein
VNFSYYDYCVLKNHDNYYFDYSFDHYYLNGDYIKVIILDYFENMSCFDFKDYNNIVINHYKIHFSYYDNVRFSLQP